MFNSLAIVIRVIQSPETPESVAHAIVEIIEVREQAKVNLDLADEVRRQVIRGNRRPGQVLLQVHRHQEVMAAAAVKAVAQVDRIDKTKMKNGVLNL